MSINSKFNIKNEQLVLSFMHPSIIEAKKMQPQNTQPEHPSQQIPPLKKVIIFIALTIPATGKSTTFTYLCSHLPEYNLSIISSDEIRNQQMMELMAKNIGMSKNQAYKATRQLADCEYYRRLDQLLAEMCKREGTVFGIFMDKNYSCLTLDSAIKQLNKITTPYKQQLNIKITTILPKCNQPLILPHNICYPFSSSYIACCMKRVLLRSNHPTLQGTESYRATVCLGWANNFRGLSVTGNKNQYFDCVLYLPFTQQQQIPEKICELIMRIMLETQVGSFIEHPLMSDLVHQLKSWKNQQIQLSEKLEDIRKELNTLFNKLI